MSDNEGFKVGLFIGFFAGLFFMGLASNLLPKYGPWDIAKIRDQCESNLPRNQNCVMQFIPEEKNNVSR